MECWGWFEGSHSLRGSELLCSQVVTLSFPIAGSSVGVFFFFFENMNPAVTLASYYRRAIPSGSDRFFITVWCCAAHSINSPYGTGCVAILNPVFKTMCGFSLCLGKKTERRQWLADHKIQIWGQKTSLDRRDDHWVFEITAYTFIPMLKDD